MTKINNFIILLSQKAYVTAVIGSGYQWVKFL